MKPQESQSKLAGSRFDEVALGKILDKLDAKSIGRDSAADRRSEERFPYRRTVKIEFHQASGNVSGTKVLTHDLSRLGISFLHCAYVHVGTNSRIELVTTHNNWQFIEGRVNHCEYIEAGWHLVGVGFKEAIDLASFASGVIPKRVLVVDDDPLMCKLVGRLLSEMRAEVSFVNNGEEAIAKVNSEVFDVVLMDIHMPVMTGEEAIKQLRESGYLGKVVAMTSVNGSGSRERLMDQGFTGYLPKPVVKKALTDLLSSIEEEPLFSSLAQEEGFKPLINEFVAGVGARVRMVEQALVGQNIEELALAARCLKGQAGSYGFEPITQAAQAVEEAVSAKIDWDEIRKRIAELVRLCAAARPTST